MMPSYSQSATAARLLSSLNSTVSFSEHDILYPERMLASAAARLGLPFPLPTPEAARSQLERTKKTLCFQRFFACPIR